MDKSQVEQDVADPFARDQSRVFQNVTKVPVYLEDCFQNRHEIRPEGYVRGAWWEKYQVRRGPRGRPVGKLREVPQSELPEDITYEAECDDTAVFRRAQLLRGFKEDGSTSGPSVGAIPQQLVAGEPVVPVSQVQALVDAAVAKALSKAAQPAEDIGGADTVETAEQIPPPKTRPKKKKPSSSARSVLDDF